MIEQVKTFRTSDGKLHEDKAAALRHECELEICGAINQYVKGSNCVGVNKNILTIPEIATFLSSKSDTITQIVNKFKVAINRTNGQKKVAAV